MANFVSSTQLSNLQVDGVYVYVQPPTPIAGSGINTSLSGIVGTGSWGPLNSPQYFSSTSSLYQNFGIFSNAGEDSYSLVTSAYLALGVQGQVSNTLYVGVRVSNGTDTAASGLAKDSGNTNGIEFTALYTGQDGDTISYQFSTGTQSTSGNPTLTAQFARTGFPAETYPNLPNPSSGAFQTNLINAINTGISGVRPASALVVASKSGTSAAAYTATTAPVFLTGGTDGATVSTANLLGVDGTTGRTGMYALRGLGTQQFCLAGCYDSGSWSSTATFAVSEGTMCLNTIPTGTSTPNAVLMKQSANAVSQNAIVVKDWVYFTDPATTYNRLVAPDGEVLGIVSSCPPWVSPGNKPVGGCINITATERTGLPYSYAEEQQLQTAGITFIQQGIPRSAALYGLANGENASAAAVGVQAVTDNIAYTRMTNYLAGSLPGILGPYVDELQSTQANDPLRAAITHTLNNWLQQLQTSGAIDDYNVTCSLANNSTTTIAEGFAFVLVQVAYMNVVKFLVAQLLGGSAIQVGLGNVPQA